MKPPADHIHFRQKFTYIPPNVAKRLSDVEAQARRKYACWCRALISGEIPPYSQAQEHFVSGAKGIAKAETDSEGLWAKYQTSLQIAEEKERRARQMAIEREMAREMEMEDRADRTGCLPR